MRVRCRDCPGRFELPDNRLDASTLHQVPDLDNGVVYRWPVCPDCARSELPS